MSLTNFPNGISSFGIPVMGGSVPANKGKVFFVDYGAGSDANSGTSIDEPYKTVSKALSQCTSNAGDTICLIGNSTHVLTEMLTVSINRVTIIGLDGSFGRRLGQNAKVSLGITGVATNIATIKNTGIRNVFANIKVINEDTVTEGLYAFVDAGEYTQVINCEIYKGTKFDVTGAADLVANGDSSEYINCYIGTTVTAISGAILRPCVTMTRELVTGAVARDVSFRNCIFARKCGNTGNRFVYGVGANTVERMALFDNCVFWNAALATATPAQNVAFSASLTDGSVLLKDCASIGAATAMSTTTGVFVIGSVPAADTTGIALQAT